jgi:hypothetical protein
MRPQTQFIQRSPRRQDARNMPQRTSSYNHNRKNNANHAHLTTDQHQQNAKQNYFSTESTENQVNDITGKWKINGKVMHFLLDRWCSHSVINEASGVVNNTPTLEENVFQTIGLKGNNKQRRRTKNTRRSELFGRIWYNSLLHRPTNSIQEYMLVYNIISMCPLTSEAIESLKNSMSVTNMDNLEDSRNTSPTTCA